LRSSYIDNNYGNVFRALILAQRPKFIVECGILDGYSTMHIASALKFNRSRGTESQFFAFDLWDEYEYKHGKIEDVCSMLNTNGLGKEVQLGNCDAFKIAKSFLDNSIDFLHMDISNDGDKLIRTLDVWGDKISKNGMIVFEGGSKERDEGWIKEYGYKPIRHELINNPIVYENWDIQIMLPFPSLTLLWRKI